MEAELVIDQRDDSRRQRAAIRHGPGLRDVALPSASRRGRALPWAAIAR